MNQVRLLVVGVLLICSGLGCNRSSPADPGDGDKPQKRIVSAKIVKPARKIPSFGDLWLSTWAGDGNVYVSWGDGTGPGTYYPVPAGLPEADSSLTVSSCAGDPVVFCEDFCGVFSCDGVTTYEPRVLTQAGLFRLSGSIADFSGCDGDACIRSIHIPSGIPQFYLGTDPTQRRGDKPSGLLAYNGTLYWFGHQLMAEPRYGYVAYSTDYGETWTEVPNSPWAGDSPFRVFMVINMGKNYELNTDGYVYGLGIHGELTPQSQPVYLARVPKDSITHYQSYRYFTGTDSNGSPEWSGDQLNAVPLSGVTTIALGAAMYHPGVGTYLFLAVPDDASGPALTLYYADQPWGPWAVAQKFEGEIYIPGIISKDTGPNSFYFTAAGGAGVGDTYQLIIAKIEMQVESD